MMSPRELPMLSCSVILLLCLVAAPPALAGPDLSRYEHRETKQLVGLVEDAAKLVAEKGEAAFAEFHKPGSRWFHDDTYIFVSGMKGEEVVNPASPEMEGSNMLSWRDANGKQLVKLYLEEITADPGRPWTWVHYLWHRPGRMRLEWKTSYVRLARTPAGKLYAVGSGIYDMKMERVFLVEVVEEAAALIKDKGEAAFDIIRDRGGRFLFSDTYVFVNDPRGVELVNPAFPGLEGRNLIRLNNPEGRPIVREYLDLAKKKGSGWIGYYWPRPGETKPSIKHVYVKRVQRGDKTYIVGSGIYLR